MGNLFGKDNDAQVESGVAYKALGAEKYTHYPYEKKELGEDMYVINQVICGYWKSRYLIDERNKAANEFMSEGTVLQTICKDDIDWESLKGLPQAAVNQAKRQDATYPTFIRKYNDGLAEVSWQLNPDGRYFMDEDGYGMTDDEEVTIYGFVDREGRALVKYRRIDDYSELDGMEKEARKNLEARK